jgi:hypothetical protein
MILEKSNSLRSPILDSIISNRVSMHRPKPKLPTSEKDFGYFFAGLVDSDGHFNKIPQLVISFHVNDMKVAYFIKSFLGYGTVRLEKNKNAGRYVLAKKAGLVRALSLLSNKLYHPNKKKQYRVLAATVEQSNPPKVGCSLFEVVDQPQMNAFWLAGFIAGDGSFQIKILRRKDSTGCPRKTEVRVVMQVDQKEESILKFLQDHLGGHIGYRKSQNTYYYSTVSFANAAKLIKFLDGAHLVGSKMTQYVLWRRAFLIVQRGEHRTDRGISLIEGIKERIQRVKKD